MSPSPVSGLALITVAFVGSASAAPLATFNFTGTDPAAAIAAGNPVGPSATAPGVSVTAGFTGVLPTPNDGNLIAASSVTGTSNPGAANQANLRNDLLAFGVTEQNKPAGSNTLPSVLAQGTAFLSFTVSAEAGSELDLDGGSIDFRYWIGAPGGNQAKNIALFSSVDGFANTSDAITTQTSFANTSGTFSAAGYTPSDFNNVSLAISGSQFDDLTQDVEFRLYFYGGQFNLNGNNGRRYTVIDDLSLDGNVAAVPEPASFALLALGAGLLGLGRGRRDG